MTRRIRIGLQAQPQHADYAELRRAWAAADAMGVDTIWNWDHFYPLYGDPDGKHFECWTLLGAMAEVTSRAEIGALVACNSYRNPQLVADMTRTVDHISGGRLIMGIGAGWFERDYTEFGYEFGTPGTRIRALAEGLPLIRERLEKGNPAPLRRVPFLVPGKGPNVSLRLVAEHADIWHAFGSAQELTDATNRLDEWCGKIGRDPAAIERSTGFPGGRTVTPEAADELHALGFTHLIVGMGGPEYDLAPVEALLAWRDAKNAG